ncbi:hypothetical protein ETB97_001591 [Aspergillus alliaceus]|uniref:Uncharacterized protein n=1 Tax=Petromyces alliaceus TaxID=209559 RepID=A0A5N6G596_PETAA|nr:uncharacterized protein BDW43DRAFT_265311 [Aspergillus alliaceus]KAB8237368.1 hypothetical protein BDW43DRAFT_265311 [Aspergillus alliaceus]KAF5860429.1 hypothetical protein ETB97_001591 [Aspergillus burnettii]
MDLQGKPIGQGPRSTKVTTDPEASRNPIQESSGPVAGDSLAAESATKGGTYSQNRGAQPLGVAGQQSTLNTKDTSSATELPSAPVGAARENLDRQERYPEALGGQGDYSGPHSQSGYVGGATAAKQQQQGARQPQQSNASQNQQRGTASASGSGYHNQSNTGTAPSYAEDVVGDFSSKKPKGQNLKEGGFDNSNNASFTTQIGSENDPGRLATKGFQHKQTESGPTGTPAGREQKGVDNQHWYQPLQSDQRA